MLVKMIGLFVIFLITVGAVLIAWYPTHMIAYMLFFYILFRLGQEGLKQKEKDNKEKSINGDYNPSDWYKESKN